MPWNRLILLAICAALCFGGTFTCRSNHLHPDDPERQEGLVIEVRK